MRKRWRLRWHGGLSCYRGKVHDNVAQYTARAAALRHLMRTGARPAVAFEQFDRERQADIDRGRRESAPAGTLRADYLNTVRCAPSVRWLFRQAAPRRGASGGWDGYRLTP